MKHWLVSEDGMLVKQCSGWLPNSMDSISIVISPAYEDDEDVASYGVNNRTA